MKVIPVPLFCKHLHPMTDNNIAIRTCKTRPSHNPYVVCRECDDSRRPINLDGLEVRRERTKRNRQVVEEWRKGYKNADIAFHFDLTKANVEKIIERWKDRL